MTIRVEPGDESPVAIHIPATLAGFVAHRAHQSGRSIGQVIRDALQAETDLARFVPLVGQMRDLQKRYFRGAKTLLDESKLAERAVDQWLQDHTSPKTLFDP